MNRTLFLGSYLQVTWWTLGQWNGGKNASNDNYYYMAPNVDLKNQCYVRSKKIQVAIGRSVGLQFCSTLVWIKGLEESSRVYF